jgi:hypothetical protein
MQILLFLSLFFAVSVASKVKNLLPGKLARSSTTFRKVLAVRAGSVSGAAASVDWRYFVAGGICAGCSHGITTPIGMFST